jgi:SAM-dependent methyltransferase
VEPRPVTSTDITPPGAARRPWYRTAFGPFYSALYRHRDEDEAERAVELVIDRLAGAGIGPSAASRVLDIACGSGRHLAALAARGFGGVGLDLSLHLLAEAAERRPGWLVRGDMRDLPFHDGAFHVALSMFTSFGYFASRNEDRRMLAEAFRVLAPGGVFVLDYFNAEPTLAALTPESRRSEGPYEFHERRSVECAADGQRRIVKTVEVFQSGESRDTLREEVAVYPPGELEALVAAAGFESMARLGDYRGGPFDAGASPRLLLVARRPGGTR